VKENGKETKKVPSSTLPGLFNLLVGTISLVVHLAISSVFDKTKTYDPTWISQYDWYLRFGYTWIVLTADRFKYYFAWKVH
jgi:hypothetical protein